MDLCAKTLLASQVGGHPGILTSEDESLLFKPALAREINFYQSLTSEPVFASLVPYIPKFYGTLRFEGKVQDGNLETAHAPPGGGKDECLYLDRCWEIARVFITPLHSIVLENLSNRFLKPNVLDIGLGTKPYDNEASEEKKARMIRSAKETTSLETGMRLTGFQVSMQRLALDIFFVEFICFAIPGL